MTILEPPTLDATLQEDVESLIFKAQKADLARAILGLDNKTTLQNMWFVFHQNTPADNQPPTPQKREIGFLEGKAKVIFADEWGESWEMTPEELDMV